MMTGWMIYGGLLFILTVLIFRETVKDGENYWFTVNVSMLVLVTVAFTYDSMNGGYYGMYLFVLLVGLNLSGFMVQLSRSSGRKALLQVLSRMQMRLESH